MTTMNDEENIDPITQHRIPSSSHVKDQPSDPSVARPTTVLKDSNKEKPPICTKPRDENARAPIIPTTKASRYREKQILGLRRRSNSTSNLQDLGDSYMSDDASVGSLRSVGSASSGRASSRPRQRPAKRARNPKQIPAAVKKAGGGKGSSRVNSAPSTPTGKRPSTASTNVNNAKVTRANQNSWAEQQRKLKEDRKKRRLQPTKGDENDVLHELEKSYQRLEQGFGRPPATTNNDTNDATERPRKFQRNTKDEKSPKGAKENEKENVKTTTTNSHVTTPVKNRATDLQTPPGYKTPMSKRSGKKTPMSYSQAVKMGNTPMFIRRLFDNKTKDIYSEVSALDPKTSEIQKLADTLFAEGTGISDKEVRKILNSKSSNANKWELKRQIEEMSHSIKVVKATANSLLKNKNKVVVGALEIEDNIKKCWSRVVQVARSIDDERNKLIEKVKELETSQGIAEDSNRDISHALESSQEKVTALQSEIGMLQEKLAETVRDHTQTSIALEVEKARCQESEKQAERWRVEIATMEAGKSEAVKEAEVQVANTFEQEKEELRNEIAELRSKVERTNEELSRLLGDKTSSNPLNDVREEIDSLRGKISDLESLLALRESELAKASEENKLAIERAASKDHTMSDLMKGLSDMQRSSQAREDEANNLRKEAENKVIDLGKELAEVKGSMSLLSHEKTSLGESLESTKKELTLMEESMRTLRSDNDSLKNDIASCTSQLNLEKELRLRSCETAEEDRNERIALSAQMVAMTKEHAQTEAKLIEAKTSLDRQWREKMEQQEELYQAKVKESLDSKEVIAGLEGEITSLKQALNNEKTMAQAKSAEEISKLKGEINMQKERMRTAEENALSVGAASAEQVRALEKQISEFHAERRRMHNLIQELRGNVRVFARIRPFLPGDGADEETLPCITPTGDSALRIVSNSTTEHSFSFDRVFPPSAGQEVVFKEVSEFVQSALDGFNVCLFSYGQTGSGKTHTMQGSGNAQMRGIIPRAIEQVGNYKRQLEVDGWKYKMHVTFVEIYNETIRDLLREKNNDDTKHEIKVGSDGKRFISDINTIPLEPTDTVAVEEVMRRAAKYRSVGSTEMNSQSSRSHSVFSLILTATHEENRQELRGTLNLVDLAGSERLDRSKAKGDRAKETVAINKSLSSLTDVFVAIGKKSSHIPFRNSKLTYLLQPCLSGDGKALMLANLSPTEESVSESLCSLRFASQVNKCELGKATSSVKEIKDDMKSPAMKVKMTPDRPGSSRSTPQKRAPRNLSGTKRNLSRLRPKI